MDPATIHSIWTVVLFVIFLGIVVWAYSSKRKPAFRDAANLPFADDQQEQADSGQANRAKENHHE